MKVRPLIALIPFATASLVAAPAAQSARITPEESRGALRPAILQLNRNNLDGVEQTLVAQTKATPQSYRWHVDIAEMLIEVLTDGPRTMAGGDLHALAARIGAHLDEALALAATPRDHSSVLSVKGWYYERVVGDASLAIRAYSAAAAADSSNTNAAAAADRLKRTIASLDAKLKSAGGHQ